MTDKARELLERTLKQLNPWHPGMGEQQFDYTLREEICAYLAEPEVKRERLSDEEIREGYIMTNKEAPWTGRKAFFNGIRFAEKHHGIGDNNENTNT